MKKHVRKAGQKLWIIYIVLGLLFLCRFEPVIKAVEILQPAAAGLTETVQAVAQDMIGITYSENDAAKKIALTFDDGPHPIYTPELLDGLRERGGMYFFCDRRKCYVISGTDRADEGRRAPGGESYVSSCSVVYSRRRSLFAGAAGNEPGAGRDFGGGDRVCAAALWGLDQICGKGD